MFIELLKIGIPEKDLIVNYCNVKIQKLNVTVKTYKVIIGPILMFVYSVVVNYFRKYYKLNNRQVCSKHCLIFHFYADGKFRSSVKEMEGVL